MKKQVLLESKWWIGDLIWGLSIPKIHPFSLHQIRSLCESWALVISSTGGDEKKHWGGTGLKVHDEAWLSWDYLSGARLAYAEHGCLLLITGLNCLKCFSKKKHKVDTLMDMRNWELFNIGLVITECHSRTDWLSIQKAFCSASHYVLKERAGGYDLKCGPSGAFQGPRLGGAQDSIIPSLNHHYWSPATCQLVCCALGVAQAF